MRAISKLLTIECCICGRLGVGIGGKGFLRIVRRMLKNVRRFCEHSSYALACGLYRLAKKTLLSTAIPRWKYRFSSDHRSQATSGSVSTWMGDRLGIPSAVDFYLNFLITNWTYLTKLYLRWYSVFIIIYFHLFIIFFPDKSLLLPYLMYFCQRNIPVFSSYPIVNIRLIICIYIHAPKQ